jgi:hypothetical protein
LLNVFSSEFFSDLFAETASEMSDEKKNLLHVIFEQKSHQKNADGLPKQSLSQHGMWPEFLASFGAQRSRPPCS